MGNCGFHIIKQGEVRIKTSLNHSMGEEILLDFLSLLSNAFLSEVIKAETQFL